LSNRGVSRGGKNYFSQKKKKKSLNPLKKNGVMNVVPVRKTWARIA